MKLLVVDDDRAIVLLVREILRLEGYTDVAVANDGQQALEVTDWDLMFLDLMLPGVSGIDVLRARPKPRNPIVVLTARPSDDPLCKAARAAGADAFLHKPFRAVDLIQEVKRYEVR